MNLFIFYQKTNFEGGDCAITKQFCREVEVELPGILGGATFTPGSP